MIDNSLQSCERQEALLDRIATAIADNGIGVVESALPDSLASVLFEDIAALERRTLKPAGVGRGSSFRVDTTLRGDRIKWLCGANSASAAYLSWAQYMRRGLNRRLFLGLYEYQAHYACYEPGAFYRRHRDTFQGHSNRLLSTVVYLNRNWSQDDGGALVIYDGDATSPTARVLPTFGTLVVFLSDRFPHEVERSHRPRFSIAGWFSPRLHPESFTGP